MVRYLTGEISHPGVTRYPTDKRFRTFQYYTQPALRRALPERLAHRTTATRTAQTRLYSTTDHVPTDHASMLHVCPKARVQQDPLCKVPPPLPLCNVAPPHLLPSARLPQPTNQPTNQPATPRPELRLELRPPGSCSPVSLAPDSLSSVVPIRTIQSAGSAARRSSSTATRLKLSCAGRRKARLAVQAQGASAAQAEARGAGEICTAHRGRPSH